MGNKYISVFLYRCSDNILANKSPEEISNKKQLSETSTLPINYNDANKDNTGQLASEMINQQQIGEYMDSSMPKSISEQQLQTYSVIRRSDSFIPIM